MLEFKRMNIEVQKRREDVFCAYYLEGIPVKLIAEFSGYCIKTIQKDLEYINNNLSEFDSWTLPENILEEAEDCF